MKLYPRKTSDGDGGNFINQIDQINLIIKREERAENLRIARADDQPWSHFAFLSLPHNTCLCTEYSRSYFARDQRFITLVQPYSPKRPAKLCQGI